MEILLLITFILLVLATVTSFVWAQSRYCEENSKTVFLTIGSLILISLFFGIVYVFLCLNLPSAIDVYRGNTELQITETKVNDKIIKKDTVVLKIK